MPKIPSSNKKDSESAHITVKVKIPNTSSTLENYSESQFKTMTIKLPKIQSTSEKSFEVPNKSRFIKRVKMKPRCCYCHTASICYNCWSGRMNLSDDPCE